MNRLAKELVRIAEEVSAVEESNVAESKVDFRKVALPTYQQWLDAVLSEEEKKAKERHPDNKFYQEADYEAIEDYIKQYLRHHGKNCRIT